MIVLMLVIFYLFLILPENKKKKKLNEMRSNLKDMRNHSRRNGRRGEPLIPDRRQFRPRAARFERKNPSRDRAIRDALLSVWGCGARGARIRVQSEAD